MGVVFFCDFLFFVEPVFVNIALTKASTNLDYEVTKGYNVSGNYFLSYITLKSQSITVQLIKRTLCILYFLFIVISYSYMPYDSTKSDGNVEYWCEPDNIIKSLLSILAIITDEFESMVHDEYNNIKNREFCH